MPLTLITNDQAMPTETDDHSWWQYHTSLTVTETATIFSRSTSWVRDRLTDRSLEAAARADGPTLVTVASVGALQIRLKAQREQREQRRHARPRLRLVVDNT